jgi:Tfp pilus assembly protein PilN
MSSLPAEKPAVPVVRPAAAPRRRSRGGLNIARRPFINTRPVTRTSILLWILGLLLLIGNVSLFWNYRSGSAEKLAELERLGEDIERQQQTKAQLEQRLATLALEQQNRQVRFLNNQIAERTFSWSLLLDRVAEAMPDDVRLTRLTPRPLGRKATGKQGEELEPLDDRVQLVIHGVSRSDEALDDFVDRLYAHEAFDEPDLSRESREVEGDDDTVEFDVQVIYDPGSPAAVVIEEAAPAPEIVEAPPAPGAGIDE